MEDTTMFERIGGFLLGTVNVLMLALVGVVFFIPDAGRYLRIKRM
jgi:hypothetical protein